MKILKQIKIILRHKYYVGIECFKLGLYWQGITHDLSKFSLVELLESSKYYVGTSSPIDEARKEKGYSEAWLHHKGRNKHHWHYWLDFVNGKIIPLEIPDKYIKEMYCDIIGASKSYKTNNPLKYFEENSKNWIMTENSLKKLREMFN